MDKDRITGAAKDVAGKVEGAVGDLTGDAQTKASGQAREAAGTVQNLYGQAKDVARDAGDAAMGFAKEAMDSDIYKEGSEALVRQVRSNPLGSLLIAGGVGFTLALLLSRPSPRRSRY